VHHGVRLGLQIPVEALFSLHRQSQICEGCKRGVVQHAEPTRKLKVLHPVRQNECDGPQPFKETTHYGLEGNLVVMNLQPK
jgi:hypothetical protein